MQETFANLAQSNLNGSINNSQTTLVVNSAASFPSTGNFRLLVDSELMLVTGVSGTTFTVTRGIESTSAASHSSGALCTHVLTAGAMQTFGFDTASVALAALYQNGWSDLSGGYALGSYYLDRTGRVWLNGVIKPGTTTAGTVVFTLPSGFQPVKVDILTLFDPITLAPKQFQMQFNGEFIYETGGSLNYVSLGGISFSTLN